MLAGGFSFWTQRPLCRASSVDIMWQLAPSKVSDTRESKGEDMVSFVTQSWKLCILISITSYWLANSLWEWGAQKCEYQEVRIIGVLSWRVVTTNLNYADKQQSELKVVIKCMFELSIFYCPPFPMPIHTGA